MLNKIHTVSYAKIYLFFSQFPLLNQYFFCTQPDAFLRFHMKFHTYFSSFSILSINFSCFSHKILDFFRIFGEICAKICDFFKKPKFRVFTEKSVRLIAMTIIDLNFAQGMPTEENFAQPPNPNVAPPPAVVERRSPLNPATPMEASQDAGNPQREYVIMVSKC